MKVYKRKTKKKQTVAILNNGSALFMSKSNDDEGLKLSFTHFPKQDDNLYLEMFNIDKKNKLFKQVDKCFSSYESNLICFDTEGAQLVLSRRPDSYSLHFINEFYQGNRVIRTRLTGKSAENDSLNNLFESLINKQEKEKKKSITGLVKAKAAVTTT